MGRESDHIHIATLTTSTSVPVRTGVPRVLWLSGGGADGS